MRLDSKRLISATEARSTLPALLDGARGGSISHILRGGAVVAHLVPSDALVITPDVGPAINSAVARAAALDVLHG